MSKRKLVNILSVLLSILIFAGCNTKTVDNDVIDRPMDSKLQNWIEGTSDTANHSTQPNAQDITPVAEHDAESVVEQTVGPDSGQDVNRDVSQDTSPGPESENEVTDLQLALLNNLLYQDPLYDLVGDNLDGHDELIDSKFKDNILGGENLVEQLRGYTLIDYDHGSVSGFKAAVFTKGDNLVIVYGGTEDGIDIINDLVSGLFDLSSQDNQTKGFATDNVKKFKGYNTYITGYSMGGRLCYLGTEAVIDDGLADNLKKVCTFNGLGVKEFIDFGDSNLSNIHNLEVKFADKTYNYIVEGDEVSDDKAFASIRRPIGYNHIGKDIRVPCTNRIDTGFMRSHDLYSVIDYLLNGSKAGVPSKKQNKVTKPKSVQVPAASPGDQSAPQEGGVDFLIGDWSSTDEVFLSFYDNGVFKMNWIGFAPEEGKWHAEVLSEDTLYIEMEGSQILSMMTAAYGSVDPDYHFEILKNGENGFYLVQVYGDYTAHSSPCKLGFTRIVRDE